MSCRDEHWAELVVGRALDALEPGDDAQLTGHLVGCDECRLMLGDMRQVSASLAYGVEDMEPPPELLDRIRAALPARMPQLAPMVLEIDELAARRRRRPQPGRRVVASLAAVAAVAAIAVVGGVAVDARHGRDQARQSLASQADVIRELQDDSSYRVVLTSGGPAAGFALVDGRSVALVTNGLDDNNVTNSTYVLWAAAGPGSRMTALAAFDIRGGGTSVVHATLPASTLSPKIFGVTEEKGRSLPATPGRAVLGSSTSTT